MQEHFVYIIYSPIKDKFYVGETHNLMQRLDQHNSHFFKSNSTKIADDWEVFWVGNCESRTLALKKGILKVE